MFEALKKATGKNKYKIEWVELEGMQFNVQVALWLNQLHNSRVFSGPSKADRKALTLEFRDLLQLYIQMLESLAEPSGLSPQVARAQANFESYKRMYREKFKQTLPLLPPARLAPTIEKVLDDVGAAAAKRDLLVQKKEVLAYWLRGVRDFNPHIDGEEVLQWQYMGNMPRSKVRLFLNVMVQDADQIARIKDPRRFVNVSGEAKLGLQGEGDLKYLRKSWFEHAIKAEASATLGLHLSGECVMQFEGIKAELKAEALVGAAFEAEGEIELNLKRGLTVTGSVEVELGIKVKGEAKIDAADVFLAEVSAEAFAGAMAKAEVEVIARIDGVGFKIGAEAFAGAKIKGTGKSTFKLFGYELIELGGEAWVSAGIGAKAELEVFATAFDGAGFKIGAGTTYGIGKGVDGEVKIFPGGIALAAGTLFYNSYLFLAGQRTKRYTWNNYFRNLEDNEKLFLEADKIIDKALVLCFSEYERAVTARQQLRELEVLSIFKAGGPRQVSPMGVIRTSF